MTVCSLSSFFITFVRSWAFWRNTYANHNYNLYHMMCISVHFSGTFGASTNFMYGTWACSGYCDGRSCPVCTRGLSKPGRQMMGRKSNLMKQSRFFWVHWYKNCCNAFSRIKYGCPRWTTYHSFSVLPGSRGYPGVYMGQCEAGARAQMPPRFADLDRFIRSHRPE